MNNQPISLCKKIFLGLVLVFFLALFYLALDANKYRAQVRAIDGEAKVGVNPTTELLDFGDLSAGTRAVRTVSIENGSRMPMRIAVFSFGDITDLTTIQKNHFTLASGQSDKIPFELYMPASITPEHIYTGKVFIFRLPVFWRFNKIAEAGGTQ